VLNGRYRDVPCSSLLLAFRRGVERTEAVQIGGFFSVVSDEPDDEGESEKMRSLYSMKRSAFLLPHDCPRTDFRLIVLA
jgi:hypothetical protein